MKISRHVVGMLQANCYVVSDEVSKDAVAIDPGGKGKAIAALIEDGGLALKAVIHTHGHRDHTGGSAALAKITGAPVYRYPGEPRGLFFSRRKKTDDEKVLDLFDGMEINVGTAVMKVIHTPGHSPGGVCLFCEEEKALFTGDTLFRDGIGRLDLKGGSMRKMVDSLNNRLAQVPDDTDVFPGHGPQTTMGRERRLNPMFRSARDLKRAGRVPKD